MVVGFPVPMIANVDTISIDSGLLNRSDWSFVAWVLRQPIKSAGLGLRAHAETCRPAFIGAVELTVSKFQKFCPPLAEMFGDEDDFGEVWEGRWRKLLSSGSRLAKEFHTSWLMLQHESKRAYSCLDEEFDLVRGPLGQPVENAGEGAYWWQKGKF